LLFVILYFVSKFFVSLKGVKESNKGGACRLVGVLLFCMLFTNFFVSPSGVEGSDKGEPEEEVAKPNPPNPILVTCGLTKHNCDQWKRNPV
jgi:hypothetical protein